MDSAKELRPTMRSEIFAVYQGRAYCEPFSEPDGIVLMTAHERRRDFPDALKSGEGKRGPWVKVPRSSVSRRVRRTPVFSWRDIEVRVIGDHGDRFTILHEIDPVAAAGRGMTGDQREGWTAVVSSDELTLLRVDELEVPV